MDISICCITYNQREYIEQTLNNFLNQKGDFSYEIVVHDDASTDGTTEILQEYEKRYPNIIRLLLEEENVYSKGEKVFYRTIEQAKGKYIAICEGDDYWCDKYKLQKQFDYMQSNPDCTYLVHGADVEEFGERGKKDFSTFQEDREFDVREVLKNGYCFPTASIFSRREIFYDVPMFCLNAPIEDEPVKLLCLSKGKGFYQAEKMCVYRKNHPGSWNARVKQQEEKRVKHHTLKKQMYREYDIYTNYEYHDEVEMAILLEDYNIVLATRNYSELRKPKYKSVLKQLSFFNYIRLKVASYFPNIYRYVLYIYKNGKV